MAVCENNVEQGEVVSEDVVAKNAEGAYIGISMLKGGSKRALRVTTLGRVITTSTHPMTEGFMGVYTNKAVESDVVNDAIVTWRELIDNSVR